MTFLQLQLASLHRQKIVIVYKKKNIMGRLLCQCWAPWPRAPGPIDNTCLPSCARTRACVCEREILDGYPMTCARHGHQTPHLGVARLMLWQCVEFFAPVGKQETEDGGRGTWVVWWCCHHPAALLWRIVPLLASCRLRGRCIHLLARSFVWVSLCGRSQRGVNALGVLTPSRTAPLLAAPMQHGCRCCRPWSWPTAPRW